MDQRQLRALVAVGELRSFSAAAKSLGTVQSNVSTHVSRLESELGVVLIDRGTTELTEEGRLVAARARRIDHEFEALASDIAAMRDVVSGTVRCGVIGTTARWLVPPLLNSLKDHYPAVRIVLLDATTSSLVLQLLSGQLDLAVVNTPLEDPDLRTSALFDEDRLLVAPLGHPLYEHESITMAELAEHELLLEAQGTSFRAELDADAAAAGVTLRAQAEVDGMRLLASLAFSGFGAAVIPASAAPSWLEGEWRRIPIEGIGRRSVGLSKRRRGLPSAAERAVEDTIREVVAAEAPLQRGIYPVP
ncbi:MAG: LysR family transcriptional regulator [Acidimicrobiales bacterium]